jgi:hypothetical protein
MGRSINVLTRFLTVGILVGLGMAAAAKADSVTDNVQVYYVGPESGDNPYGLINSGGNTLSYVGMTTGGAAGTLGVNTTGNPGISLVSNTPGVFNIQLYGNTSGIISGGQLVTGTYSFDSSSDTFAINGSSNTGVNPVDIATINVASNGIVTLQSDSLEVVTQVSDPSPAPEIDPENAMSAFALIAIAVPVVRSRRRK